MVLIRKPIATAAASSSSKRGTGALAKHQPASATTTTTTTAAAAVPKLGLDARRKERENRSRPWLVTKGSSSSSSSPSLSSSRRPVLPQASLATAAVARSATFSRSACRIGARPQAPTLSTGQQRRSRIPVPVARSLSSKAPSTVSVSAASSSSSSSRRPVARPAAPTPTATVSRSVAASSSSSSSLASSAPSHRPAASPVAVPASPSPPPPPLPPPPPPHKSATQTIREKLMALKLRRRPKPVTPPPQFERSFSSSSASASASPGSCSSSPAAAPSASASSASSQDYALFAAEAQPSTTPPGSPPLRSPVCLWSWDDFPDQPTPPPPASFNDLRSLKDLPSAPVCLWSWDDFPDQPTPPPPAYFSRLTSRKEADRLHPRLSIESSGTVIRYKVSHSWSSSGSDISTGSVVRHSCATPDSTRSDSSDYEQRSPILSPAISPAPPNPSNPCSQPGSPTAGMENPFINQGPRMRHPPPAEGRHALFLPVDVPRRLYQPEPFVYHFMFKKPRSFNPFEEPPSHTPSISSRSSSRHSLFTAAEDSRGNCLSMTPYPYYIQDLRDHTPCPAPRPRRPWQTTTFLDDQQ